MPRSRLRIAIVGGGIGGLAAAYVLRRHDFDVTVYEQASAIGEIGAGVQITPNALRLLERLGLGDAITSVGARFESDSSFYRMDGTFVSPSVITDSSGWNGLYGMHRADLLDVFASRIPAEIVNTGHRAVGFHQDEGSATVEFENGATATADLVIGADGIRSSLRRFVTERSLPVFSNMVAYRGLLSTDVLPGWPRNAWELWAGEGSHFLVFPVRRGTMVNYVGFVPSTEETAESWSAPGDPDDLRAAFRGWDPRVEQLLSNVESTFWWGLYDRDPLERWSNGRLTLLGDAAHPMLPHLGQGVNQAIEDGVTLATVLSLGGADDIPAALRAYERLRLDRTRDVQAGSRKNAERYDSRYEDLEERDRELREHQSVRWPIYDYDAEATAREAFASK